MNQCNSNLIYGTFLLEKIIINNMKMYGKSLRPTQLQRKRLLGLKIGVNILKNPS